MSCYRESWEDRCLPCQLVEPCSPPYAAAAAERLSVAVDAAAVRERRERARAGPPPAERAERYQLLEQRLAERAAAKEARKQLPLSGDAQATKDAWARWRAEQVGAGVNP